MSDRATLHVSKFADFVRFAETLGYRSHDPVGAYEVIRLHRPGRRLVFHKRDRTDHATVSTDEAEGLVRRFLREGRP